MTSWAVTTAVWFVAASWLGRYAAHVFGTARSRSCSGRSRSSAQHREVDRRRRSLPRDEEDWLLYL